MGRLKIDHLFDDIVDIWALGSFTPKHVGRLFDRFLERTGVNPKPAAMFEDSGAQSRARRMQLGLHDRFCVAVSQGLEPRCRSRPRPAGTGRILPMSTIMRRRPAGIPRQCCGCKRQAGKP